MKAWIALRAILMKDIRHYYIKPPNISWGIIFPLAWGLMFVIRSGSPLAVRDVLPGIIAMAVLFGTTSMLAVTITFEKRRRSFDRLLLAPVSLQFVIIAKTLGAVVFGCVNGLVPVAYAAMLTDLSGIAWGLVLPAVVLTAVVSTFLGLFIAVSVAEVFEAQTFSNFFRFPMVFLCGLFIPLADLPLALRSISYVLPLTYGVDVLKTAINRDGIMSPAISLPILAAMAGALLWLSTQNAKKRWIR